MPYEAGRTHNVNPAYRALPSTRPKETVTRGLAEYEAAGAAAQPICALPPCLAP